MKITIHHVLKLLKLLDKGLVNGMGETIEQFCVQQAVHRVILDEPENEHADDHPPSYCINDYVRQFGITLNDQEGWANRQTRAKGLKRFAVAELGSDKLSSNQFYTKLRLKLAEMTGADETYFSLDVSIIDDWMGMDRRGMDRNGWLKVIADTAADVLADLGSEGGQFLYLVDEPDKEKRRDRALRLGHQIFAAQLAEERHRWGLDSDYGLPVKGHHHPKLPAVRQK